MNTMRIIKLITPTNEAVNIEISSNEAELKDLLSLIAGVLPSDIKGIKDKYGNYYTISFAVNNYIINSEFSDVYYLICARDTRFNTSYMNLSHMNNYMNLSTHHLNMSQQHGYYMGNPMMNSFHNNNPNNLLNMTGGYNNPPVPYQSSSKSLHKNISNNKYGINNNVLNFDEENSSPSHNIGQRPMTANKHKRSETVFSPVKTVSSTNTKEFFFDKCLSIAKDLNDKGHLDDKYMPKLKQMILLENEDIGNLFKIYTQELIERKTFIESLVKLLSTQFDVSRPTSPASHKNKMLNIIEQLENNIFSDPHDITLLKNLIQFDNEFIIGAFEVYEADNDIENLIDSIKRLVNRYKRNSSVFLTNPMDSKKSVQTDKPLIKDEIQGQRKLSVMDIQIKSQTPKPFSFNKEIETYIYNNLHTEQKIMFKYGLRNKLPDAEVLVNYYEILGRIDLLLRSVKIYTKNFINNNIIKELDDKEKVKFDDLINERNSKLLTLFRSFNEHSSIERLGKEVCDLIKNGQAMNIIGSSDSDGEDNSVILKNKKFSNLIKSLTLKPSDKNSLEELFQKKNNTLDDIIDEWERKKDITLAKGKIEKLLNKNKKTDEKKTTHESSSKLIITKLEKNSPNKSYLSGASNASPNRMKPKYNTFEEILTDLETFQKISPHQHKYLLQRFKSKDDVILSAWEVYTINNNIEDLIESIKIFSSNRHYLKNDRVTTTPIAFAAKKSEIINFLKSKDNKEKDEIKSKQYHIIELLAREGMLNKNFTNVINEMIQNENYLIISAFEIFSVTKDHWDFCETLNLITDIYNNSSETRQLTREETNSTTNSSKNDYIDGILSLCDFNQQEQNIIRKKYAEKDEFLLSTLEFYEKSKEKEELLDNLNILVKT
jgi:hypothetical protein